MGPVGLSPSLLPSSLWQPQQLTVTQRAWASSWVGGGQRCVRVGQLCSSSAKRRPQRQSPEAGQGQVPDPSLWPLRQAVFAVCGPLFPWASSGPTNRVRPQRCTQEPQWLMFTVHGVKGTGPSQPHSGLLSLPGSSQPSLFRGFLENFGVGKALLRIPQN